MSAIVLANTFNSVLGLVSTSASASTLYSALPTVLAEHQLMPRSSQRQKSFLVSSALLYQLSLPSLLLRCQPACPLILSFHIAQRVAWIFGLNLNKSVMQCVMHCVSHHLLSRQNNLASVGCLHVEYRVQKCVHFHFAVFVTKCLGLHLLLTYNQEPRPVSLPLYHSVSRTVS